MSDDLEPLTEIHVEPAHHDGQRAVGAHDGQEQRRILRMSIMVDRQEYRKARNGNGDTQQDEGEAVARLVGGVGHDHGPDEGGSVGGDRVELCCTQ